MEETKALMQQQFEDLLELLLRRPEPAFVIAEVGKQFFQFAGSLHEPLYFSLPTKQLTDAQLVVAHKLLAGKYGIRKREIQGSSAGDEYGGWILLTKDAAELATNVTNHVFQASTPSNIIKSWV